jgi:DNA replication protein DnaC
MSLFDMDFIEKHENVIFLGPPGVGKTHLAIVLATKACSHGFKVYFTTMDTLIRKLKEIQSNHFVSHRYERSSTIITSNKSFIDWQELFGNAVIATAILDRLLHHCRVVNIKGNSYRLRQHALGLQNLESKKSKGTDNSTT